MQRAKDRERNRKTQIAQGYDLVEAVSPRDIGPRSQKRNQEKQDASRAH
jgi:hypothetical protein